MNRVTPHLIAPPSNRFSGWAPKLRLALFALFLPVFALAWARLWLPWTVFPDARWPEALLLVLAAATPVASLACELPGQNVMLASLVIAFVAGAAQSLGALTAMPFGPYAYTGDFGQPLFHLLPWPVPLVWIAAVFASRGTARLVLRPWRNTPAYGFRLIGLSTLLAVLLDLGLEPFATRVMHYWAWNPARLTFDWYGMPWINSLGWAVTTLLILVFATPSLINKKPVPPPAPDYSPLVVWLLLNLLFATGAVAHHLWLAVGLVCVGSVAVAVFAIRGARWQAP